MAGFANAWANSWPLVLLAGAPHAAEDHKGSFQEADHAAIARPFSKLSVRAQSLSQLPGLIDRAVRVSLAGRPGPCLIDLPQDVLEAVMPAHEARALLDTHRPPPGVPGQLRSPLVPAPCPTSSDLRQLVRLLIEAKRPLLVLGKGVAYAHAETEACGLAELLSLPVLPTPMGKGLVPDDHPLCVGAARAKALSHADVVIMIGARVNWMMQYGERFAPSAHVVQVDVCAESLGQNLARHGSAAQGGSLLTVQADARELLAACMKALKEGNKAGSGPGSNSSTSQKEWLSSLRAVADRNRASSEALIHDPVLPMSYQTAIGSVRDSLPSLSETVVVNEGSGTMDVGRVLLTTLRARHRLDAGSFATMGLGIGYAIAAQLVQPASPVVAVLGDSAVGFSALDIETAARFGLPITVVVINNNGIYSGVDELPRPTPSSDPRNPAITVPFLPPTALSPDTSYERLAEALGGRGWSVHTPGQLRAVLPHAMAHARKHRVPTLINVHIEILARKPTAMALGGGHGKAAMLSRSKL